MRVVGWVAMLDAESVEPGSPCAPIRVSTRSLHAPRGPASYDFIRLVVARAGSAFVFGEFGRWALNVGDVLALAPATLCGIEPEGWVTATTVLLDRDYLVDQMFWRHAHQFTDRLEASRAFDSRYAGPATLLRLGQDRAGMLMPWLDELSALTTKAPAAERFYRIQSLTSSVLDVLLPYLQAQQPTTTPDAPTPPRSPSCDRRRVAPLRAEARTAAMLLRNSPEHPWTLRELAYAVHLSPSQLGRVFASAFGKTPIAYLGLVRAERMAALLRGTLLPIRDVAGRVGWSDPDYAARQFRRYAGMTPTRYRALGTQPAGVC
ncbi:MAG: helix-turn-helix transcriptional regulator [Actinomycetes bacterium]